MAASKGRNSLDDEQNFKRVKIFKRRKEFKYEGGDQTPLSTMDTTKHLSVSFMQKH